MKILSAQLPPARGKGRSGSGLRVLGRGEERTQFRASFVARLAVSFVAVPQHRAWFSLFPRPGATTQSLPAQNTHTYMTPYETRSMRARALARACGVVDGLSVLGGLDAGAWMPSPLAGAREGAHHLKVEKSCLREASRNLKTVAASLTPASIILRLATGASDIPPVCPGPSERRGQRQGGLR